MVTVLSVLYLKLQVGQSITAVIKSTEVMLATET